MAGRSSQIMSACLPLAVYAQQVETYSSGSFPLPASLPAEETDLTLVLTGIWHLSCYFLSSWRYLGLVPERQLSQVYHAFAFSMLFKLSFERIYWRGFWF